MAQITDQPPDGQQTPADSGTDPSAPISLVEEDRVSLHAPAEVAPFPVVGVGASAGGLEALKLLFGRLGADTCAAFVVVQHLDPERPSMLRSVLEGSTPLPVVQVTSGMPARQGRIHVIPSASDLAIEGGILKLVPRRLTGRLHLPIDSFFQSLAQDRRDRAMGVVLSGTGADGTEGLRAIKAEGGISLAQEPESAQFRGMPESALDAGVVDFRGSPEQIAEEIQRLCRHPYVAAEDRAESAPHDQEKCLAEMLGVVRQQAGIEFSGYKRTTVLRRIERRMVLRGARSLEEYAKMLHGDPAEARALAQDMLIHVTTFFRDPEAFTALQQEVFAGFAQRDEPGSSIRIWVPGCSTGEEVYALAICLLESLGARAASLTIKLFGTDLSEDAIGIARGGRYSEAALAGVAPERLSRFFDRSQDGYRITKSVRDLCVFIRHDLTQDPPFAKLDLISCRNVLIYFEAELQRRVILLLHHCLNKQGYLFLGQSETVLGFRDLFVPVDKEHRIFLRIGDNRRLVPPFSPSREAVGALSETKLAVRRYPTNEAQKQADHLLLSRYAPPGVIVNDRLEVIQFRGRTGAFLEQPPGQPQTNLLRMAREDLVGHIHEAIERAKTQLAPVRKDDLQIQVGGETRTIDLEVVPLGLIPDSMERYFLVLFDDSSARAAEGEPHAVRRGETETSPESVAEINRLKAQLVATKDYLQSIVAEHQSTTDDLAATNEEMVAANEELQSTNEELQSTKEELQSTNEELSTVNDELRNRNQELDQLANDLVNVLSSVEIPVIIVDLELRVRRFTPAVREVASFIPEDVGRPIDDLRLKLVADDLPGRIKSVIDGISPKEWDVQRQDGRWFRMHVRPYRTADQRLDGAVVAFVDVDILKQARNEAESARDYARNIVETVTAALVVLDASLCAISANAAFLEEFSLVREQIEGKPLFDLVRGFGEIPAVREVLETSIAGHTPFSAFEITTKLPRVGQRTLSLSGRPIVRDHGASMMLLTIDDVTDLRALEAERALLLASEKQARLEAERANHAKDLFLATLSHELRTPLSAMLTSAQLLNRRAAGDPRIERTSAAIERATQAQSRLIDDLLDVSGIVSGKLMLDLGSVDFEAVVHSAIDIVQPAAQAKALDLKLVVDGPIGTVYGDELRLQQVVNNLLTNAIKFTPHGGRISVRLAREGDRAQLSVTDTGMGIRPEVLPHIFNRFVQADSSVTRRHGGLGLGLSIVRHLVEAHHGKVEAESLGEGMGATFRVTLPLGGADASKPDSGPRTSVGGIAGVRVLLVEDDDDTREAYAAMLGEMGAVVRAEPSAKAGLVAVQEFHPQVILSDIAMPGEDGFSFMQKVRRLRPEEGGRVPAATITALASNEERQRALAAGFQMHVAKPIDTARLVTVVRTLVDWPSPPGEESAKQ